MSVLLEALKRAALEKKGTPALGEKTVSEEKTDAVPPLLEDPAQQGDDQAASAESEFGAEHTPDILSDLEILEEDEWDQHEELDIEIFSDDDPEAADDIPRENGATAALETEAGFELHDKETLKAFSAADAASKHDVEDALRVAAEKVVSEQHKQAEVEASQRAADRQAFLAQQKEQAEALAQKQKKEQEQAQAREKAREAEQAQEQAKEQAKNEQRKAEQLEGQQRQQEAELQAESKAQGENEIALTRLVHEGHELNRRQKRRSRFLYAMLVVTAVGGIVSYYFYLLGNNSLQQLTAKRQANQEVVSLIGHGTSDDRQTGEVTAAQQTAAQQQVSPEPASQATQPQESISQSNVSQPTDKLGENALTADQSTRAAQRPTSAMETISQVVSGQTTDRQASSALAIDSGEIPINTVAETSNPMATARRADQPPSANLIFNQFVSMNAKPVVPVPVGNDRGAPARRVDNMSIDADHLEARPQRVHIYHKATPTDFSTLIQQAYAAYQSSDLGNAERLYDKALNLDPRNRDALLGAAAVASARGNVEFALRLYQLRLNEDPSDSYAKAGLLTLSNHATLEIEAVDELLSSSPGAAHLHFLKGAIYAARAQWKDAQAAFFEAHHWDKSNPDYAYNLAVSLDHLGQSASAARFYRQALQLSGTRQTGFSADTVRQRLAEIGAANG